MGFTVHTYTEDGNEVILGGRIDDNKEETIKMAQSLGATKFTVQQERIPIYHMGYSTPQSFVVGKSQATVAFPTESIGYGMAVSGMFDGGISMGSRLIGGSPQFFDISLVSNPTSSGSISAALYDWAEKSGALNISGCLCIGCAIESKDIKHHTSDCALAIQLNTPPEAIVPGVF